MLVYAAVDRARARKYTLPLRRIAAWTDNLSAWGVGCTTWKQKLAEALLLASLAVFWDKESIPYLEKYFRRDTKCSWQSFLNLARDIIRCHGIVDKRGGDDPDHRFLVRWFSRLDVFGSFSDPMLGPPLPLDAYWPWWFTSKALQVDCLLGISRTCISILAKIAVVICRRREFGDRRRVFGDWLNYGGYFEAGSLELLLSSVLKHPEARRSLCSDLPEDSVAHLGVLMVGNALLGTGKAYLTQLLRREYFEIDVQTPLQRPFTVDAEMSFCACMLLPMFVAGALTRDKWTLEFITAKLERLTESGMERVSSPCLDSTALMTKGLGRPASYWHISKRTDVLAPQVSFRVSRAAVAPSWA